MARENILTAENDFINSVIAYEDIHELSFIVTLEDARNQSESMAVDFAEDFPESLKDPEMMRTVWNYCLLQKHLLRTMKR